ncbi:MAG: ABC-type transport system, involved in lipoprotein release, permease component [Candidatus Berkelbacteria bacterium Licking1014_2]|uniref:ABC-type transport system, involved in lipoprotein release, permease component n=1 Tax=Candidatus Berkelbacteria bacterium Licking1014_2 TaxID=2017146 RepID=A0A554LVU8_9BACT|nr:MAG: ABC-type transport system, involved in lipoprotein release, permease component [Candidatus Berkelbacteria bacterium Licking1014_2]
MKITDGIRLSMANLFYNKLRTALTVGGIGIGIAAIVFLVALGYGLQSLTIKKITSIDAITTITVTLGKTTILKLDKQAVEKFSQMEEVDKICPTINLPAQFKTPTNDKLDITINAVGDSFFRLTGIDKPLAGDLLSQGGPVSPSQGGPVSPSQGGDDQTVISSALVKALNSLAAQMIGQTMTIEVFVQNESDTTKVETKSKTYKIIGVVEDDTAPFAYVPLNSIDGFNLTNYNSVKIKAKSQNQVGSLQQKITDMGYTSTSVVETIKQINQAFQIIKIVLALLGVIGLLVASIGMFNTMTIALLERTHDIGVIKALGFTNRDVWGLFLWESISIGFLGGLLGVIIGLLISQSLNWIIIALAKSVGEQITNIFEAPWLFLLLILGFSIFVGLLTGFYPARRAAKINPMQALKYE